MHQPGLLTLLLDQLQELGRPLKELGSLFDSMAVKVFKRPVEGSDFRRTVVELFSGLCLG